MTEFEQPNEEIHSQGHEPSGSIYHESTVFDKFEAIVEKNKMVILLLLQNT